MMKIKYLLLLLSIMAIINSCSSSSDNPTPNTPDTPEEVKDLTVEMKDDNKPLTNPGMVESDVLYL